MTGSDHNTSTPGCVTLCASCVVLVLAPDTAFAYIDPGTGSVILQVLLGVIAAIAVTMRLFWRKILAFFGIGKRAAAPVADSSDEKSTD